jgi:hypothetical protein
VKSSKVWGESKQRFSEQDTVRYLPFQLILVIFVARIAASVE